MSALFPDALDARMASPGASGRRRAALLLHGMDPKDRAWALARLSESERGVLEPLLDELEAMGVPDDAGWVEGALHEGGAAPGTTAVSPRQRIATAPVEDVLAVLAAEPLALAERVLALGPWPWQAALCRMWVGRLPSVCEPAMARPQASQARAPLRAVDQALLDRLAARLNEVPASRSVLPGSSGDAARWPRVRDLLQSLAGRLR